MLRELVEEDLILEDLNVEDKEEVIKEMVAHLSRVGVVDKEDKFIQAVEERERLESTAIGGGVAIPHARSEEVKKLSICVARSKKGVDFSSLDGKPVHLIFMIACPPNIQRKYLQVLARIARFCKNEGIKKKILEAKDRQEIISIIRDFDLESPEPERVKLKAGRAVYKNK